MKKIKLIILLLIAIAISNENYGQTLIEDGDQDTKVETDLNGNDEDYIRFYNNGNLSMLIDKTGRVGINGTPTYLLDVFEGYINIMEDYGYKQDAYTILKYTGNNLFLGNGDHSGWTGSYNLFSGVGAGNGITSGSRNTFSGYRAGYSETTHSDNTFFGYKAGYNNRSDYNTFIGTEAGYTNDAGENNTFLGYRAGYYNTADDNTFLGYNCGNANTTGALNTFAGFQAGDANTTGSQNVFIGYGSGSINTTGSYNTNIGYHAGDAITTGTYNICIGHNAGPSSNASNTLYIGNGQGLSNTLIFGDFTDDEVGIGTITPDAMLDIVEAGTTSVALEATALNTGSTAGEFAGYGYGIKAAAGYGVANYPNITTGVLGEAQNTKTSGYNAYGVKGVSENCDIGYGVYGLSSNATEVSIGVYGDGENYGVKGVGDEYGGYFDAGSYGAIYSNGNLIVNGDILPNVDDNNDLGSSGKRWTDIHATNGTIQTSDRRFKTEITNLNYGLDEILKLRPVEYIWKSNIERGKQIGLISQEVYEVIPEIVDIGDDSMKTMGLHYDKFCPVLINAIKEQQEMIEILKEEIDYLKEITNSDGIENNNSNGNNSNIYIPENNSKLFQNNPNPFTNNTEISYFLDAQVFDASIIIYNINGVQLKRYDLPTTGNGKITISSGELVPGIYLYTLIADSVEIDTKRMLLTD